MKKTFIAFTLAALAFGGCQKEVTKADVMAFSSSDFTDTRATSASASRETEVPNSNLKLAIRKIEGSDNTYRFALKIDSIRIDPKNDGVGKMEEIPQNTEVYAGLSVLTYGDNGELKESVVYPTNSVKFKRENQNGFMVYVSEAFTYAGTFDFEMVSVDYKLRFGDFEVVSGWGIGDSYSGKSTLFSLPGGKTVTQDPVLAKVKDNGKWIHSSGLKLAKTLIVTIDNDPAQEAESLIFSPKPVLIPTGNPENPFKELQLPSVTLVKTFFNQNAGVARFGEADAVQAAYKGVALPDKWTGEGTFFYKRKRDGRNMEIFAERRALGTQPFYTVVVE